MQDIEDDYYAILGVSEEATPDDIRKGYLKLAKKLHPDRFPNDPEKRAAAQAEFSRVTRAHEVLGDAKQRDEYNAIRLLAKSRMALETGSPGAAASGTGSAQDASRSIPRQDAKQDKEAWAAKHFARCEDCFSKKRFQEAEIAIKEAIRLLPDKAMYHAKLAEIYLARGWKTLAQTEIQTALRIDPKSSEAKSVELKLKVMNKGAGGSKQAQSQSQSKDANKAVKDKAGKEKEKPAGLLDQIMAMLNKKM